MIITIKVQSPEELTWLQPFLEQLQARNVAVTIQTEPAALSGERNYDPLALRAAVQQAQAKRPFRRIADPVTWQKRLRDEWE